MIKDRILQTSGLEKTSRITGIIKNGLQQGTINSPELFNIANSDLLNLFGLNNEIENSEVQVYAVAFLDDLNIIAVSHNLKKINDKLSELTTKTSKYFLDHNMKVNASKCESVVAFLSNQPFHENTSLFIKRRLFVE